MQIVSALLLWFLCHFKQLLHCNDVGTTCIVRTDGISFARFKGVMKQLYFTRLETSFHAIFVC